MALRATAAVRPDVLVEVFLAVVIREFLARLDVLDGIDEHPPPHDLRLAVWSAGVIDISGDVFSGRAVYRAARADLKEILAPARIFLGGREGPAEVFDDALSFLIGTRGEKTESGAFYATGCVPHDCGGNDGFMAVDPAKQKVYFARRGDNGEPQAWPPVKDWPADIKKAYDDAQGSGN